MSGAPDPGTGRGDARPAAGEARKKKGAGRAFRLSGQPLSGQAWREVRDAAAHRVRGRTTGVGKSVSRTCALSCQEYFPLSNNHPLGAVLPWGMEYPPEPRC
ncbi:hypothetical protein [Azospirillum argentinense]